MKEFLRDDHDEDVGGCTDNDQQQFLSSLADFIKFNDDHVGEDFPNITVDELQNAL